MGIKEKILEINSNRRTIYECQERISQLNSEIKLLVVKYIQEKHPEWLEDSIARSVNEDDNLADTDTIEIALYGNTLIEVRIQCWPDESELKKINNWDFDMPVESHIIKMEEINQKL